MVEMEDGHGRDEEIDVGYQIATSCTVIADGVLALLSL